MPEFEWDPAKAASNLRKHNVSFENAAMVFSDPLSRSIPDEDHSHHEDRWITVGRAAADQLLVVSHTLVEVAPQSISVRLISARVATPGERRQYESGR